MLYKSVEDFINTKIQLPKMLFIDCESEGLHYNTSYVQIGTNLDDVVHIIKINDDKDLDLLRPIINSKIITGYNLAYDLPMLKLTPEAIIDVFYLTKIAHPELGAYSLNYVVTRLARNMFYKNIEDTKKVTTSFKRGIEELTTDQITYMTDDILAVKYLLALPQIKTEQLNLAYKVGIRTLLDVVKWQENETPILTDKVQELKLSLIEERNSLTKDLDSRLGYSLNVSSYKQVREYLNISISDVGALTRIANGLTEHSVDQRQSTHLILKIKKIKSKLSKLKRFEVEYLKGRFNPMGTATSRWNCAGTSAKGIKVNPHLVNLQNYPRDFKPLIGVTPNSGEVLITADYATLELRISACVMGEETLYKALMQGEDPHKTTAMFINNVTMEEVTSEMRTHAKPLNFGLMYGMGADILQQYAYDLYGISWTIEETKEIIKKYFGRFNKVKDYHNYIQHTPHCVTALGYKAIPNGYANKINMPTQGTGAEVIRVALNYMFRRYPITLKYVFNVIHDAIYMRVPIEERVRYGAILKESMLFGWTYVREKPIFKWHDVPMEIEVESGFNLKDMEVLEC